MSHMPLDTSPNISLLSLLICDSYRRRSSHRGQWALSSLACLDPHCSESTLSLSRALLCFVTFGSACPELATISLQGNPSSDEFPGRPGEPLVSSGAAPRYLSISGDVFIILFPFTGVCLLAWACDWETAREPHGEGPRADHTPKRNEETNQKNKIGPSLSLD